MSESMLSVILPTDEWATIVPVIDALRSLACRVRLEVVIVIPQAKSGEIDPHALDDFGGSRIVTVESVIPLGPPRAAGVRAAKGEWVFIGETHSFPRQGMFEALAEAHEKGCTVAVPGFYNWNDDGATSRAGFITGYAPWTEGRPAESLGSAPIFNVSYARSFLLALGDRLDNALSEGEDMMERLRGGGRDVQFVPEAQIEHANISSAASFLHQRYLAGRVIAGARSREWKATKRALYAAASPLIPLVLLRRNQKGIAREIGRSRQPVPTCVLLLVGTIAQAVGELTGYARGDHPSVRRRYDEYELRRLDHVTSRNF